MWLLDGGFGAQSLGQGDRSGLGGIGWIGIANYLVGMVRLARRTRTTRGDVEQVQATCPRPEVRPGYETPDREGA